LRKGDVQLAIPYTEFTATKAVIEAIAVPVEGMIAYASDTHEIGTYGTAWEWSSGAAIAPVSPSVVGNIVSFADIVGGQADSGIAAADVASAVSLKHAIVTLDANADTLLSLSTQELGLDTQAANMVLAGPAAGADAVPTIRTLVAADIPNLSSVYQPLDAFLTSIGALGTAANKILVTTGVDAAAEYDITAAARALLDDATSAAMLSTLGIGGLATNITATKTLTLTCADNFNLTVPGTGVALVKATALTAGYIPFGIAGNLVGEDAGLFWDNVNKRLGVGTTSPGAKLEVASPSSGGIALKVGRVSGQPSIRGISATDWLIVDAGTSGTVGLNYWSTGNVILAHGGGKVGIGIITPGSKLQVNGNAAIGYSASTAGPANGLVISGKVGIGTTSPRGLLNVRGYTGGTSGSAVAAYSENLVIGGAYNQTYNSGNAVLLHIADYSNDAGDNVYPIYVESENNNVDFYVKSGITNAGGTAYFGGNVGIGTMESTVSDGIGLHIAGKIIRIGTAKTPASAGATGNTGEICWDAGYIYVCMATNTWKRVAIATW